MFAYFCSMLNYITVYLHEEHGKLIENNSIQLFICGKSLIMFYIIFYFIVYSTAIYIFNVEIDGTFNCNEFLKPGSVFNRFIILCYGSNCFNKEIKSTFA